MLVMYVLTSAFSTLIQYDPKYASGDALWGLDRAQEMAADLAGARRSLEMLTEQSARPEILFELASVQARLGDADAALDPPLGQAGGEDPEGLGRGLNPPATPP